MRFLSQHNSKSYTLPTVMWIVCVIFYGYQYFLQVSPSVMAQNLMHDFNISATAIGNLAACYFYTYAGMQIPVGIILDRCGVSRPLTIAVLLCVLGCLLFALTNYFSITVIGRLLIGLGASFAVVSSLYISAYWLPLRIFTFLIGITVAIGMLGAICGQAPLAMMTNYFGWRNTMLTFAVIGSIIFLVVWLIMRDLPRENQSSASIIAPNNCRHILSNLKSILKNRQIWLLAIYGGLMFMPISVIGSLWGTPFLMHKYNLSNTDASALITILFLGLAVGSPTFGWFSDRIRQYKKIMFASSFATLFCLLIIIYLQCSTQITTIALFCYGFFTGGSFVCYTLAREMDATNNTGSVMGFMNTLNMLGGALGQPLVGYCLDQHWQGVIQNGIRTYSTTDFQIALTALPISIICAILFTLWIKKTPLPVATTQCIAENSHLSQPTTCL